MAEQVQPAPRYSINDWALRIGGAALGLVLLAFGLALAASQFQGVRGWQNYLAGLALGSAILLAGWLALRSEAPRAWLAAALITAALLRLAAGVLWFTALPAIGHGSPSEVDGYIMADAYERDQAAWKIGDSDRSLLDAFGKFRKADQYGSLLFLSAVVYRVAGGERHQPLLMVIVTAAFSALAVPFTWAFTRRAWGRKAARLAAWGLALYPEAILLGSSQMREPFIITLSAAALYGLVRYGQERSPFALVWVMAALLLSLPMSPPLTALLLVMLAVTALVMGRKILFGERALRDWRFWLMIVGLVVLILLGLYLAWRQFAPQGEFDPLAVIQLWIRKSAQWQAYLSRKASGWIQKLFNTTPDWAHLPLLLTYGVLQPFLPAALVVPSDAPVWYWIGIWRAAGWTLLIPPLIYAPLHAFTKKGASGFTRGLSLAVWIAILAASYRGGADQWDNPRYRAAFAGLQIALAAWVFMEQRRSDDPWLRRALVSVGLVLAWFLPWYVQRMQQLPVMDVIKIIGLGLASAALFTLWDWARMRRT